MTRYKDNEYRYTANGELTEKTNTDTNETTQFDYDAFSNLRAVQLSDGINIEYIIDGQNRRVGKKRNGTLEQGFLYQGQLNPVAELDGNNNITARFVYGDRKNVLSYMIKDGTNYRIVSDHLGSVKLVVNASTGEIAQRMDYDAWGNVTQDTSPGFQPFGYAGAIYDRDTGLVRFGARDYDPVIGRWTKKDLIGFGGGINHYAYASLNPIGRVDLDGKDSQDIDNILNHISNSPDLNKPGFRFEDDIDNGDRTAQYDFGSNEIVLDSALECKDLSKEEYLDLYKTLYHETLHHNQSFFEVAVDQWVELFGGVGPYHQDIFEQTSDLYLDPQSTAYDDVVDLYEDTH